jgi:hypothetical protein
MKPMLTQKPGPVKRRRHSLRRHARAALEGKSLSDYLVAEIKVVAERPSPSDLRRRLSGRARVRVSRPPADLVREERDAR